MTNDKKSTNRTVNPTTAELLNIALKRLEKIELQNNTLKAQMFDHLSLVNKSIAASHSTLVKLARDFDSFKVMASLSQLGAPHTIKNTEFGAGPGRHHQSGYYTACVGDPSPSSVFDTAKPGTRLILAKLLYDLFSLNQDTDVLQYTDINWVRKNDGVWVVEWERAATGEITRLYQQLSLLTQQVTDTDIIYLKTPVMDISGSCSDRYTVLTGIEPFTHWVEKRYSDTEKQDSGVKDTVNNQASNLPVKSLAEIFINDACRQFITSPYDLMSFINFEITNSGNDLYFRHSTSAVKPSITGEEVFIKLNRWFNGHPEYAKPEMQNSMGFWLLYESSTSKVGEMRKITSFGKFFNWLLGCHS